MWCGRRVTFDSDARPAIQVSSNLTGNSGRAVNPVASGLDLNGDGITGDRTSGFKAFEINAPEMLQ